MTSIGVFAGVFDSEGKVLCVRHAYGERDWGMPGGQLEAGEDPLTCLHREVAEETGCSISVRHFVGAYSAAYKDDLVLLFAADLVEAGKWEPNDEIAEIGWFDLDALPAPMAANPRLRCADLAEGARGVMRVLSAPGVVAQSC